MPRKLGEPWCSQHDCHPEACWEVHNPTAAQVAGTLTTEEATEVVKTTHVKWQKEGRPKEVEAT